MLREAAFLLKETRVLTSEPPGRLRELLSTRTGNQCVGCRGRMLRRGLVLMLWFFSTHQFVSEETSNSPGAEEKQYTYTCTRTVQERCNTGGASNLWCNYSYERSDERLFRSYCNIIPDNP